MRGLKFFGGGNFPADCVQSSLQRESASASSGVSYGENPRALSGFLRYFLVESTGSKAACIILRRMLVEPILNLAAHTGTVNRSEDSQGHKRVHQKKIGSARARLRAKYRANKPDACTASGMGLAVPLVTTLSKATIAEPNPASFSFPNNPFPPPAKPAALSCGGKSSKDLCNFKIQFWVSRPDCSFMPVWGGRSLLQIGGSVEQSVFSWVLSFHSFLSPPLLRVPSASTWRLSQIASRAVARELKRANATNCNNQQNKRLQRQRFCWILKQGGLQSWKDQA